MKRKHIESFLQDIDDFPYGNKAKFDLQQHMTPPAVAAELLYDLKQSYPLHEMAVADIGVGTGMLICGLLYAGAGFVHGFEIDGDCLNRTQQMLDAKVEGANYSLIQCDIKQVKGPPSKQVDLVVMNPPFGTKIAGIDICFLEFATKICSGPIYSMHKTSTRPYLERWGSQRGYDVKLWKTVQFPLAKRFGKYHKKDVAYAQVDVLVFIPTLHKQPSQINAANSNIQKIPQL